MSLINPADSLERQNEKLLKIATALMRKVEQKHEQSSIAYAQFERAALLEVQVKERTTELERTLDLLQESNAQLEFANFETEKARANLTEALETIKEGFALFDPSDRLELFNSRFCRDLKGLDPFLVEGLLFKKYVELISKSPSLSLPPDVSRTEWATRRLERHGDNHAVFNVSLTDDRWLQISEHRTARGGTVILQTDVTNIIRLERLERDRMRDEQAQILQATLDHLNQGVCIFDNQKNLVGWNDRMDLLFDLPPQRSAFGQNFISLFNMLEDQLEFDSTLNADMLKNWAGQNGNRKPMTFEVIRDQRQIYNLFCQEMPNQGFVISFTDVTNERAAAKAMLKMNETLEREVANRTEELGIALSEAERANASKSRFVAAASHDLLQPLSAAKLFMSSLADQITDPDLSGTINKAETAMTSVEQIIEALLDISKLDASHPVFDIQNMRLAAILGPLRDELTPVAQAKGLDLRIIDCSLTLRSDPNYLRRIVQNLITNAIRYTDKGKIVVGVRRRKGIAHLEVWDTGRGIAEQDQHSIFQEFKRLDAQNVETGLGLGLAIVDRACKSLNHPLRLWSEPGTGSCFSFSIPIHESIQQISTLPRNQKANSGQIEDGLIVFLVENDPKMADAMTLMIESWGADVIHAENGELALSLLADIDLMPDVFLLDYQLGNGMSGTELFSRLKAKFGAISARLISANRSENLQKECQTLGLKLLPKPINRPELLSYLESIHRKN